MEREEKTRRKRNIREKRETRMEKEERGLKEQKKHGKRRTSVDKCRKRTTFYLMQIRRRRGSGVEVGKRRGDEGLKAMAMA